MAIIRGEDPRSGFTILDNRAVFDPVRVSWAALGMLTYLLSRPPGWTVNKRHLATVGVCSMHAIDKALGELVGAGYAEHVRSKRPDGTFEWDWIIRQHPDQGKREEAQVTPVVASQPVAPTRANVVEDQVAPLDACHRDGDHPDGGQADGQDPPLVRTDVVTTEEARTEVGIRESDLAPARPDVLSVPGGFCQSPSETAWPAAHRLCGQLADAIASRGSSRPVVSKTWLADMERLLRLDRRDEDEVAKVIRWLNNGADPVAVFWRPNVRSPAKLRQQWDHMREQYEAHLAGVVASNGRLTRQQQRSAGTTAALIKYIDPEDLS